MNNAKVLSRMTGGEPEVGRFEVTQSVDEWFIFITASDDTRHETTMPASATFDHVFSELRKHGFNVGQQCPATR